MIALLTLISAVLYTFTPKESVTVTDSKYVPATVSALTEITPVFESIVIPSTAGEMLNVVDPVPPDFVKAVDDSGRPNVVSTSPPPLTVSP